MQTYSMHLRFSESSILYYEFKKMIFEIKSKLGFILFLWCKCGAII